MREAELGVAVKYALVEALNEQWGETAAIRRRYRAGEVSRHELLTSAQAKMVDILPLVDSRFAQPHMRTRLADLVVDALFSEPLSPELLLPLQPQALPDLPIHALIFNAFPHVLNEIYPLMVDAYAADLSSSTSQTFQVVGVHENWLSDGSFMRAIAFDVETLGVWEADVAPQPSIASAQILALNLVEEDTAHARIAQALGDIPLLNPLVGSRLLDNKAETAARWVRAGLPTPECVLIRGDLSLVERQALLQEFLDSHQKPVFLKPAGGTEGRGVTYCDVASTTAARFLLDAMVPHENYLVSVDHGGIRFAGPEGPVRCTLRLNVCWNGEHTVAESGYAQVAGSLDGIASAGRGGRLVSLTELWAHLCTPEGEPVSPTAEDWTQLTELAAAGIAALADAPLPALIGVDILLDITPAGKMLLYLLEANPRPAGMAHSRLISFDGPRDEPGISPELWRVVQRMLGI
ncbi:MAG: hypothetical protein ACYC7E_12875 [Armatimonadota bacterium]